jgi:hypothetical protein
VSADAEPVERLAAVLRDLLCGFEYDVEGIMRSELLGTPDEIAAALAPLVAEEVVAAEVRALREAAGQFLHEYPEIYDTLRDRADRLAEGVRSDG